MEVYEARLESFGVVKVGRKQTSTAKGGQPIWPHSDPSPEKLAQAGFYWDPNDASTDRVTCCLCQTVLDGWEPNDDPIKEHYNYSPNCGIAIHAQIEQNMENGVPVEEDPTSEAMVLARKATFRDLWPHEKKRGWTCKTQKVAEAGWYYCPTSESDDFVKCAYCGLSLDGWEPKDKPFDEHQRRSEGCIFFTFSKPAKTKGGRSKKSTTSKASRLSTQSTATALDDTAMVDESVNEGDTVLTTATDMTQASTTSKAKKGGRAKKGKAKGKNAATPATSILEPEDDDFEVKVGASPKRQTRGKKRKSEEIEPEEDGSSEAPAPKRQAKRARSSTVKPENDNEPTEHTAADVSMIEAGDSPAKSTPKKAGKRAARSRAPSTRKASTRKASKTAKPAPTPAPADEELDAALEADLDRSEAMEQTVPSPKPAPKSRAASKAQSKKAAAAAAAIVEAPPVVERTERESTVGMETFQTANEDPSSIFNVEESLASIPPIKNPKQRGAKKGKKADEPVVSVAEAVQSTTEAEATAPTPTKDSVESAVEEAPTQAKGRQPSRKASRQATLQTSRQASRQKAKEPEPKPEPEPVPERVSEPSIRIEIPEYVPEEVTMIHDPLVREDDAAAEKSKRGKKAGATTKKGKKGKVTETIEDAAEEIVEAAPTEAVAEEPTVEVEPEEPSQSKPTKAKTAKGRPKGKKTAKIASVEEPSPEDVSVEAEPLVEGEPESELEPEPEPDTETIPAPTKEASATPVKSQPSSNTAQQVPSPTPSPQSSDAENHPPSSRPSATRPPLAPVSPVATRQVLAVSTPTAARVNLNPSKLATSFSWSSVDLDLVLNVTPGRDENVDLARLAKSGLTSPEKGMTVEDWIRYQAELAHERLRVECETTVQKFENEGVRALKALEGIVAEE